jgi:hypothetical protein
LVDPSFINIDDSKAFTQLIEQGLGELLAKHQGPLGVAEEGNVLDLLVPKAKAGPEDLPDPPALDLLPILLHNFVLDLLGIPNAKGLIDVMLRGGCDPMIDGFDFGLLLP